MDVRDDTRDTVKIPSGSQKIFHSIRSKKSRRLLYLSSSQRSRLKRGVRVNLHFFSSMVSYECHKVRFENVTSCSAESKISGNLMDGPKKLSTDENCFCSLLFDEVKKEKVELIENKASFELNS